MTESRIELTDRLRREGRWAEASKRKDEIVKELRTKGMKSIEAREEAWRRLPAEYPPLPSPAELEHVDDDSEDAGGRAAVLVGSSPLPDTWGDLPDSAPLDIEVEWVHQNRVLVVEERSSGKSLLHWDRARKRPPSYGAVNLMEFAATNRKGFMDILQRVKPGDNGDAENIRREKTSIEDIRSMLQDFNRQWAEDLIADVPKAVSTEVSGILEYWAKRFRLMIPIEARADLEAHLAGLVQESLDAVAKVETAKEDKEKRSAHIREALEDLRE